MEDQLEMVGEGRVRRWLVGLTLGVTLMLALLPATGRIFRERLVSAIRALALQPTKIEGSYPSTSTEEARIREIVGRYPMNAPVQLAAAHRLTIAAVERNRSTPSWPNRDGEADRNGEPLGTEYASLSAQFPEDASIHANLLRFATSGVVRVLRPESEEFFGKKPNRSFTPNPQTNRPKVLASFLAHATAGEQLEPNNAYFPAMSAIALFATHRDDEALAALRRAAAMSDWREHYQDECYGAFQLDEALGKRDAITRTSRMAMILFPHYSQLRAVTRVAGYLAMKSEQNGDHERGLAIRRDVMRIGSCMRVQGQSLITNLVGMALVRNAMFRPGGAPAPSGPVNEHGEEKDNRVATAYQEYLNRIGHPEEAAWVRAERDAATQVRQLLPRDVMEVGLEKPLYTTALYWTGAAMLLLNAAWWLVLGMLAAGLASSRWGRSGQPLSGPLKRGLGMGIGVALTSPVIASMLVSTANVVQIATFLGIAALVSMPVVGGLWLWRNGRTLDTWSTLGGVALTMLAVPGAVALVIAQGLAGEVRLEFFGPSPSGSTPTHLWMLGASLALPVVAGSIFAIAGRVLGVPVAVSLARGFRGATVPVICLLLLAYGGTVLATTRQEARLDYNLHRTLENEGRFLAELSGKPWPD